MKFLLYAFLIYLLYLLVFRLVIPIYITTRKVKQGFREMQQKMEEQMRSQQQGLNPDPQPNVPKKSTPKTGDYIDFEEL
ncbi:MAG: hypothetical protein IPH18_05170 [Chitinophagaceae bacterium]|nr:hypothetical protein [Chitinophagaceae bacterium]